MNAGDLMTTKEAAEILRVSHFTVSRWIARGVLPGVKVGPRCTRVRRSDLEGFITPIPSTPENRPTAPESASAEHDQ